MSYCDDIDILSHVQSRITTSQLVHVFSIWIHAVHDPRTVNDSDNNFIFSDLFRKVGLSNVDIMFAPHRIAVF